MAMLARITWLCACIFLCGASTRKGSSPSSCNISNLQADCKKRRLTAAPSDLPANTTSLFLDENQIKSLKANAFSGTPDLLRLTVTNCGLTKLDNASFSGLSKLTELRLNNNALTSISNQLFGSDLGHLKILYLNYNSIGKISQNALDHLVKLQELYLDHNHLTLLHPHAFTKLTSIKSISIEFNRLKTARKEWFYPVNKTLTHISLHNNSWVCDCQMSGYKLWTSHAHKKFGSAIDIVCSDRSVTLKSIHGKDLCQLSTRTVNVTLESVQTITCSESSWQSWSFLPRAKNKTTHEVTSSDEGLRILSTGLVIKEVKKTDAGIYCCAADSTSVTSQYANKHCTTVRVYSSPASKPGSNSSASVVVVVILVVTAVVCLVVWFLRRKRRNYGLLNDEV